MESFNTITWFLNMIAVLIVVLPVYYLIPRVAAQQWLLIFTGAALFFFVAPRMLLFCLLYWALIMVLHRAVARTATARAGRGVFAAALVLALSPMLVWKILPVPFYDATNLYGHLAIWTAWPAVGQIDAAKPILAVIGLSYATFRAVDLLIQTRLRLLPAQSFRAFWTYALFPPIQVVGPISEYREICAANETPKRYDPENIAAGGWQLFTGIVKVYVLAYPLAPSTRIFQTFDVNATWVLWWELLCFMGYFYLNFAGFSDIAIGLARVLGYTLRGNFNWPYFQPNIQAFWNNWHMSLTRFAQRNVYIPAGGYRKRTQYRAIIATMMVIALWHGISVSFVIFGLYHAAGLCVHRWWSQRPAANLRKPRRIAPVLATFVFVSLSFPLVMLPPPLILPYHGHLFGIL